MTVEQLDDYVVMKDVIERMKSVNEEELADLADLFKIFSDSTRIRIMYSLFMRELNVQEIADSLGMQQSAISHQLRILRASNLVKVRREGKNIYYRLSDSHVFTIFSQGLEHISE
ncbi:MAG: winged helix-turn-helix transcriptional regulator [Erysipelotrichaceae bacterium]|nr:winged helix-turn-helix transcriptional regulator [Erysipelotrichaceae bacterium]